MADLRSTLHMEAASKRRLLLERIMHEHHTQIDAFLDALGRRWRRLAALRLVTRLALGVAVVWAAAALSWLAVGRSSAFAESVAGRLRPRRNARCSGPWRGADGPPSPAGSSWPGSTEDRVDGLDDRLVTVVDVVADGKVDREGPMAVALVADTSLADAARWRERRRHVRHAERGVVARRLARSALALGCIAVLATPTTRVARMAWLYVSPVSLVFDVQPGNIRLRPATPLTIRVRASAAGQGLAPRTRGPHEGGRAPHPDGRRGRRSLCDELCERAGVVHLSRRARRTTFSRLHRDAAGVPARGTDRFDLRVSQASPSSRAAARRTAATSTRPPAPAFTCRSGRTRPPRRSSPAPSRSEPGASFR